MTKSVERGVIPDAKKALRHWCDQVQAASPYSVEGQASEHIDRSNTKNRNELGFCIWRMT
jgi:hypothetical protein